MKIEKSKPKSKKTVPKKGKGKFQIYPFEFRLKVVKLYLEEDYSQELICEEFGICHQSIQRWVKSYETEGENGLKNKHKGPKNNRSKLPASVKEKIVDLKQENPMFGIKRISQILKRCFFMKASAETVRKTLHEKELIEKPKRKPKRNAVKPRFFERSTPNQLWQSDICMFRLGGQQAYVIGYIDDYSRFLIGLGLYRSQTAENVIETYRCSIAEYGVPKEMLTDNGRQYTNWRGTTRFEKELQKEKVKHIKSQPHHPQTLGKIERLWKTLFSEFLQRAQFESFENARERLAFWVKYYNYKRPHQGIGGLCPADRFFEIQNELRGVLEKGVEENALELALRGKPNAPFYMVGRMGDRSIVIHAEKGKMKMLVDGEEQKKDKEIVYDLEGDKDNETDKNATKTENIQCDGEMQSSSGNLDRTTDNNRYGTGIGCQSGNDQQVAGHCNGSHIECPGAEGQQEPAPSIECETGETAGTQTHREKQVDDSPGTTVGENPTEQLHQSEADLNNQELIKKINQLPVEILSELLNNIVRDKPETNLYQSEGTEHGEEKENDSANSISTSPGTHHESAAGINHSQRSSQTTECVPQNLLQMGDTGSGSNDGSVTGQRAWTSSAFRGSSGEPATERAAKKEGPADQFPGATIRAKGVD